MKEEKFKKQEDFIEKIRTSNLTRHPFYYILTMGCQLNENDSEKLCGMLEQMGYYKTEEMAQADIIVFNTFSQISYPIITNAQL